MGCSMNQKERKIRLFLVYYTAGTFLYFSANRWLWLFTPYIKKLPALQPSLDDESTTEIKVWKQTSRVGVHKRVSLIVHPQRELWALDTYKKNVHITRIRGCMARLVHRLVLPVYSVKNFIYIVILFAI